MNDFVKIFMNPALLFSDMIRSSGSKHKLSLLLSSYIFSKNKVDDWRKERIIQPISDRPETANPLHEDHSYDKGKQLKT